MPNRIQQLAAVLLITFLTIDARANDKPTPRVDMSSFDFQVMDHADQNAFLNSLAEVLNEAESAPKQVFTIKHDDSAHSSNRDVNLCLHGGWLFGTTSDQHCQFEVFNKGCGDSKVRCAPWTGSQECVPLGAKSPLLACFKPATSSSVAFGNAGDATTFALLWNIVGEVCQSASTKSRSSCQNLMAFANQKRNGFRFENLDDSNRRFGRNTTPSFSKLLIANQTFASVANAESNCGYDEKTQTFLKKNGDKLHFLFGAHADPATFHQFTTETFKSPITAEKRAALINSYLALPTTQNSLHDLHVQAQQLKLMAGTEWAGTEYSPTELSASLIKAHRDERKTLVQIMHNSGVPDAQINDVLLLNYGPVLDQELAKSEADHVQDIVAAEDLELRNRFHELEKNVMSEDLNHLGSEGRFKLESLKAFTKVYTNSLINNHLPDATDRETVLSTISDTETKAAMNSSFKALYDLIATKIARDKLAASRFLNHSGNGVIVYGKDHKEGLMAYMNDSCKAASGPTDEALPANNNAKTTDARVSQ